MAYSPEVKRKIWQVMEVMKELKKDSDQAIVESARLAEGSLEYILQRLNERKRT